MSNVVLKELFEVRKKNITHRSKRTLLRPHRTERGGIQADMILINLVGKSPEEALRIGQRTRQHAGYDGHTPPVVTPEKYGIDLEGTGVNVSGNDWITYPEDAEQLHNLLARLLSKSSH